MSLREILHLTQIVDQEDQNFTTKLFSLFINVLIQLSDLCVKDGVDISRIHAFDYLQNEWAIALMQVYEKVYGADLKAHG
jgi:hypothetical protein